MYIYLIDPFPHSPCPSLPCTCHMWCNSRLHHDTVVFRAFCYGLVLWLIIQLISIQAFTRGAQGDGEPLSQVRQEVHKVQLLVQFCTTSLLYWADVVALAFRYQNDRQYVFSTPFFIASAKAQLRYCSGCGGGAVVVPLSRSILFLC